MHIKKCFIEYNDKHFSNPLFEESTDINCMLFCILFPLSDLIFEQNIGLMMMKKQHSIIFLCNFLIVLLVYV